MSFGGILTEYMAWLGGEYLYVLNQEDMMFVDVGDDDDDDVSPEN